MSEHEVDARETQEKSYSPSYSQIERIGMPSNQAASCSQSPLLFNPSADFASCNNYFAALDATVEDLQSRAQNLIDKVNEGRNKDQALIKNFNESLSVKVNELCQRLEDRMYLLYDHHNKLLQDMLQELPEIIDRIGQLQAELKQVSETVATVYKDLCVQPEI